MAVARREVLRWMAVSAATSLACRRHDTSSPPQAVAEGTSNTPPSARGGEPGRPAVPVRVPVSDLPLDGRKVVWYGDVPVEVRRVADGFEARSLLCTHFGCPVKWVAETATYKCPCHNGEFDRSGDVVGGPPVRPLRRVAVRQAGDEVVVGDGT